MADPAKLLAETIAAYEGGPTPALPPLIAETSWLEKEWERWNRMMQEWFFGRVPSFSLPRNLTQSVPYVCAFLAVLLGIGALLWWWSRRERAEEAAAVPAGTGPGDPLAAAVAGGRFGEAARWRWRRFLAQRRYPSPTTPREASGSLAALRSQVDAAERLLFGDPAPTADAYRHWDETLRGLEGDP